MYSSRRHRASNAIIANIFLCLAPPIGMASLAIGYHLSLPENYIHDYWMQQDYQNQLKAEYNRDIYAPRGQNTWMKASQDQDVLYDRGPSESDKAIERMNREFQEKINRSTYESGYK